MIHTRQPTAVTSAPPCVFAFDPDTGRLVSYNDSAATLLAMLELPEPELATLSAVEKRLARSGRVEAVHEPANSVQPQYELRKVCKRPDGTVLKLSRIWGPGANTILIIEDCTLLVQSERRMRLAQILIDRMARAEGLNEAIARLLRGIGLYTGWPYAEAWIVRDGVFTLGGRFRSQGSAWPEKPVCPGSFSTPDLETTSTSLLLKAYATRTIQSGAGGFDTGLREMDMEGLASERERRSFTAVPLVTDGVCVAVLLFGFAQERDADTLIFDVLDGISDRLAISLKAKLHMNDTEVVKRQLAELLAAAGDAIITIDDDQKIRLFNRAAEELFGYAASEVLDRPLDMLLPEGMRNGHRKKVEQFSAGGSRSRFMGGRPEICGRRKDGSEFPAEATVAKVSIGERNGYTAIVRDLTALRNAQRELETSEVRMLQLVSAMPFGLAMCNAATSEIIFANDAFQKLMNGDSGVLTGRKATDFIMKIGADAGAGRAWWECLPPGHDLKIRTVDGATRATVSSIVPLTGTQENLVIWGCYDNTEGRRAFERLRHSEKMLNEAQRLAQVGNWELDVQSGEYSWSDEMCRILQMKPRSHRTGLSDMLEQVHDADRIRVEQAFSHAMNGDGRYSVDHRIVLEDGTEKSVHQEGVIEFHGPGLPARLLGTMQDVTEIKRIEKELKIASEEARAANQAKSRFLANMSHELRTPLNAIIGFSEMMSSPDLMPFDEARFREYAGDITESGRHLLMIVNDILDLSRIEAGNATLDEEDIDVAELLQGCLRMVEGKADREGIDLRDRIAPGLPALYADARICRQAVINLLTNAVKFTPSNGRVTLEAECTPEGALEIAVRDTGIGIASEDIERVLQPFMQVESQHSRQFGGVGLGLSLTREFARLQGAKLSIDSEPGKGTRVSIRFPASRSIGWLKAVNE